MIEFGKITAFRCKYLVSPEPLKLPLGTQGSRVICLELLCIHVKVEMICGAEALTPPTGAMRLGGSNPGPQLSHREMRRVSQLAV